MWPISYWFSSRSIVNITFSFTNNYSLHQQFIKNFIKYFVYLALFFISYMGWYYAILHLHKSKWCSIWVGIFKKFWQLWSIRALALECKYLLVAILQPKPLKTHSIWVCKLKKICNLWIVRLHICNFTISKVAYMQLYYS